MNLRFNLCERTMKPLEVLISFCTHEKNNADLRTPTNLDLDAVLALYDMIAQTLSFRLITQNVCLWHKTERQKPIYLQLSPEVFPLFTKLLFIGAMRSSALFGNILHFHIMALTPPDY